MTENFEEKQDRENRENRESRENLETKVALLIQRVESLTETVRGLTDGHEKRIRDVELGLIQIRERQTSLSLIQTALTILAGVAVYILK